MNSRTGLLVALLGVQLVLVAWMFLAPAQSAGTGQMLDFERDRVTRISIDDRENTVVLTRQAGAWRVEEQPADTQKVEDLLETLALLDAPWPVADSAGSVDRFETGADNYQRRVALRDEAEDVLGELLFGTSPSYQQTHARNVGNNQVYSVAISNFELGVGVNDWLDKSVLALDAAPEAITVRLLDADTEKTVRLNKQGDAWTVDDLPADPDKAATYSNRFTTLQIVGTASAEAVSAGQERARIEAGDTTYVLSMSGEDYLLRRDEGAAYRLATYIAEQLLMVDEDFQASTPEEGAAGPIVLPE